MLRKKKKIMEVYIYDLALNILEVLGARNCNNVWKLAEDSGTTGQIGCSMKLALKVAYFNWKIFLANPLNLNLKFEILRWNIYYFLPHPFSLYICCFFYQVIFIVYNHYKSEIWNKFLATFEPTSFIFGDMIE